MSGNRGIRPHTDRFPGWLTGWMEGEGVTLWGAADLAGLSTPRDGAEREFPLALSWAIPMDPRIMAGLRNGPTEAYADAYSRVNALINRQAETLATEIQGRGYRARPLAASDRTDSVGIRGDFPHKTAATRAGLGWVGRHCQLVTRPFGPWVRLGTVFTDLGLSCGPPVERHFCGHCHLCVEACPAGALTGDSWHPGIPRERLLDAEACDRWKNEHYHQYHGGHNCGICSAVCPYGLRMLDRTADPTATHEETCL